MRQNQINISIIIFVMIFVFSCQKEKISTGTNIQDIFYVENQGAKMPVLLEGNIDSGVILLYVHGGPGGTAIGFQNDEFISVQVEPKYAVAYWDQRAAGGSQGSSTPKAELNLYVDDLKSVINTLKYRYGANTKIFLLSHSWGGLIAPAYLTEGTNQDNVKGWINVAGAHNYIKNDSLTREYLLSFGKDQIAKDIHKSEWQEIVTYAEAHAPDYTYETSIGLNSRASTAEGYIDDIFHVGGGINNLLKNKTAFSFFWFISNAGATYFSGLNQKIMYADYSTKLKLIKLPLLCITGKYDFTVPRGLADEVMQKVASAKKKLVILPHSGHIVMDSEPDAFYGEIIKFVEANK